MPNSCMLNEITPMIITLNEVANVKRTLEKLRWATQILVIDSGSKDGTLEVLAGYPQVEVIYRRFDGFAEQCNFGLRQLRTSWVLSLDADYELSDELVQELGKLEEEESIVGYRASFVYCIYGRRLRGTLYPPRIILHRVRGAIYANEGHGHRIHLSGKIRGLRGVVYHDDRKPLSRWFTTQQLYAGREAEYLLSSRNDDLSVFDRIRRIGCPAPIVALVYLLLFKGCLLNGWPGWFYTLERVIAEGMIALEVIDRRLHSRSAPKD